MAKKPGPPRLPHNRPRGSRGSSGRQFTAKALARLMRNVDRDVLREAVDLANLQDLFTPAFEPTVLGRLEAVIKTQEEHTQALETLEQATFVRVLLIIIRSWATVISFLPPGRIVRLVGLFIGVGLSVVELIDQGAEASTEDIKRIIAESGLAELIDEARSRIQAALDVVTTRLREAETLAREVLEELQTDMERQEDHIQDVAFVLRGATEDSLNRAIAELTGPVDDAQRQAINLVVNTNTLLVGTLGKTREDVIRIVERTVSTVFSDEFTIG